MKRIILIKYLVLIFLLSFLNITNFAQGKVILNPSEDPQVSSSKKQFDWQRTDQYIPPNFETYFPDDEEGGKKLDALWNANDKDSRSDEEILSTVRNGLRRSSTRKLFIRWIGSKYVWGKQPQNPEAIEIMYHAIAGDKSDTTHNAVYFGLSVVQPKTPNILRALVELCMRVDDPNDLSRVAWGTRNQRDEILPYLKPYLDSTDEKVHEKALTVEKILKGELKAFEWARDRAYEKAKVEYTDKLPEIKEKLSNGNTQERKEVISLIKQNSITLIMDDSFIEAWRACAKDPDSKIRAEVARTFGGNWVWSANEQKPEAIELMIELSKDENREVRHNSVYFGLSTVREPNDAVVRRLLEIAIEDKEPNNYHRIRWGLERHKDKTEKILNEYLNQYETNPDLAYCAYHIYEDFTGKTPANPERYEKLKVKVKEIISDTYVIVFGASESFKPQDGNELFNELKSKLPNDIKIHHPKWKTFENHIIVYIFVDGVMAMNKAKQTIEENSKLKLLQIEFTSPESRKIFEESKELKGIE